MSKQADHDCAEIIRLQDELTAEASSHAKTLRLLAWLTELLGEQIISDTEEESRTQRDAIKQARELIN